MRQAAIGLLCGLLALAPAGAGTAQPTKDKDSPALSRVERLREDLRSDDPEVRKKALESVERSGIVELAPEVVALVDDPKVRIEAMSACGWLGRNARAAVPKLVKALKDPSADVRYQAAHALGTICASEPGTLDALVATLKDPEPRVRIAAAYGIGNYREEGRPALPALIKALKDPDADVRFAAACTLARVGQDDPAAVEALLPLLKSDNVRDWDAFHNGVYWNDSPPSWPPRTCPQAARPSALGRALPLLIKGLESPTPGIRACAAHALGKAGPAAKGAVPALTKALGDESVHVQRGAAGALRQIGPDAAPALPALVKAYETGDDEVRMYVIDALGNLGPEAGAKAAPHLADWLPTSFRAYSICRSLEQIGPPAKEATPALVKFLEKSQDQGVRVAAALALYKIEKHAAAVPALTEIVRKGRGNTRGRAAVALTEIGADGQEALPALIDAVRPPNEWDIGIADALGKFGRLSRGAVPSLVDALDKTEEPFSRMRLAVTLWKIDKHPRALPTLTALLKEERGRDAFHTRYHAARSLGELGKDAAPAAPDLAARLRDEDSMVRWSVAKALGEVGAATPGAVDGLEAALKDHVWTVQAEAARSLGQLGPDAKAALPALREAGKDPLLADAAKEAVRRIEAK